MKESLKLQNHKHYIEKKKKSENSMRSRNKKTHSSIKGTESIIEFSSSIFQKKEKKTRNVQNSNNEISNIINSLESESIKKKKKKHSKRSDKK